MPTNGVRKPRKNVVYYDYNGKNLILYPFSKLRSVLGKSKNTILKYERLGFLPKPLFRLKGGRLYTDYELSILADCKYRYGVPWEIYADKKYRFFEELKKGWESVRKSLINGKEPDVPLILEFKSQEELLVLVEDILRKAQVFSTIYSRNVLHRLKQFRRI